MLKAYDRATLLNENLHSMLLDVRIQVIDLQEKISGSKARKEIGEENKYPTIWAYLWSASSGANSTYGPTKTHEKSLDSAKKIFLELEIDYNKIEKSVKPFVSDLEKIGAPKIKN